MPRNKNSCNESKNGESRSFKKEIKLRRACPKPNLSVKPARKSGITVPKEDSHPFSQDLVPAHKLVILEALDEAEWTQ